MKRLLALCLVLIMVCSLANASADLTHKHSWGSWQIRQPAGCVTQGIRVRKCKLCNHKQTSYIDPVGHRFNDPVQDPPTGIIYRPCEECTAARLELEEFKAVIHERKPYLPKLPKLGQVTLNVSLQGGAPEGGFTVGETVTFQYQLENKTSQALSGVKLLCTEFSMSGPDSEMNVIQIDSVEPASAFEGTFTMTICEDRNPQAYDWIYESCELNTHFSYQQRLFTFCATYNGSEAVSAPDLVVDVRDDPTDLRLTLEPAAGTTGYGIGKPLSFNYTLTNISKQTLSKISLYLAKSEYSLTYMGYEIEPAAATLSPGQSVSGTCTVTFYLPEAQEETEGYDWSSIIEKCGTDPRNWDAMYDASDVIVPFSGEVSTIVGYARYTTQKKQQGISNINYILLPLDFDVDFQVEIESPKAVYHEGDEITFRYTVKSRVPYYRITHAAVEAYQLSLYGMEVKMMAGQKIIPDGCFAYYGQEFSGRCTTRISKSNGVTGMTAEQFAELYGEDLADPADAPTENQRAFAFSFTGQLSNGSQVSAKETLVVDVAP